MRWFGCLGVGTVVLLGSTIPIAVGGKVTRDENTAAMEPTEGYALVHVFFNSSAIYKPEAVFYDSTLLAIVRMRPAFNSANKPPYFASGLVPVGSHVFWSKDRYGIAAAEMRVEPYATYYYNADTTSRGEWTDQRPDPGMYERIVPTPEGRKWAEEISREDYQRARWLAQCRPILAEVLHSAAAGSNRPRPPDPGQTYSARLTAIKNTELRTGLSSIVISKMVILAAFTLDGNPECSDYRVLDVGDLYHGGEGGGFKSIRGREPPALIVPLDSLAADDTLYVSLGLYMTNAAGAPRLLSQPGARIELSNQLWRTNCVAETCSEFTRLAVGSSQPGETVVLMELIRTPES